jgi:hypothetical protein
MYHIWYIYLDENRTMKAVGIILIEQDGVEGR